MKLTTYKFIKQPVEELEFIPPTETKYYFQTGIRRSIRIIPLKADWENEYTKKGDVYRLEVTCVYRSFENKIEHFGLNINKDEIERVLSTSNDSYNIWKLLIDPSPSEERNKEQFEKDFNAVLNDIKSIEP